MTHTLRAAFAVAALLCFSQLAHAGPIEWSYSARVRTTTGVGVLDLGTHRLSVDPSGNGTAEPVFGDYTLTAPLPEQTFTGAFPAYDEQQNEPIRLFSVGHGYRTDPAATAPAADPGFVLAFTLTDGASGQSGTVEFAGRAGVATSNEFPPSVLFSADMDGPAELTLGRNRYRVTPFGGLPDETEEPAVLGVRVESIAQTPEPATLALAGLGLGALGVVTRRRRAI